MDGANDVAMVASDAVRDAPSPPSSGYDMGDSACSGVSSEASVPPDGMDVDIVHEPPRSTAARTRPQRADCSENPSRESGPVRGVQEYGVWLLPRQEYRSTAPASAGVQEYGS